MARTTQRDVMRDLLRRLGGDHARVVAAYAAAERRGDVKRASNVRGMAPEEYASRLYADGVKKGWMLADRVRRGVSFLALVGAGLALVAGCAAPGGTLPPLPLARDLPAGTSWRLPTTPPPNLIDAGLSSGNDTPVISFYSLNEPIVSVCQATQEQCLSLLPTARVIPRSDTGPDVTVLIEAGENGVVPLTEELERYWAEVDLVAGRPAWLGAP